MNSNCNKLMIIGFKETIKNRRQKLILIEHRGLNIFDLLYDKNQRINTLFLRLKEQ